MLQLIDGLPEVPEFIAKEGTGRFDLNLAEQIARHNPVQWRPRHRHRLRDRFTTRTAPPAKNSIPFAPEKLEPHCFRAQRELVLFFDYMVTAVENYTHGSGACVRGPEYRAELFSRYAGLLNYLERRMGRRVESQ